MPGMDIGIDNSEFKPYASEYYFDGMLYYGDGKLTDSYYLKNVYLKLPTGFTNKGQHVVYVMAPEVVEGEYLTTCPIKGVAMKTEDKTAAFAKVIKRAERPIDRHSDVVLRAYVEFL